MTRTSADVKQGKHKTNEEYDDDDNDDHDEDDRSLHHQAACHH